MRKKLPPTERRTYLVVREGTHLVVTKNLHLNERRTYLVVREGSHLVVTKNPPL